VSIVIPSIIVHIICWAAAAVVLGLAVVGALSLKYLDWRIYK